MHLIFCLVKAGFPCRIPLALSFDCMSCPLPVAFCLTPVKSSLSIRRAIGIRAWTKGKWCVFTRACTDHSFKIQTTAARALWVGCRALISAGKTEARAFAV